jgi:hypothetical protein
MTKRNEYLAPKLLEERTLLFSAYLALDISNEQAPKRRDVEVSSVSENTNPYSEQ